MKMIFMIMIMMSTTMITLKHPLSMGFNLILITFMSSITMSMWMKYTWYSYILVLVMLGGMLVLFMYMASIASNEIMKFSFKTLIMMVISMTIAMILLKEEMLSYNSIMIQTMDGQQNMSMMKLFNTKSSLITIMMALYLLMTMIYVIFITNTFEGPMRKKN
uniref:NADH dehydrogenase subunit 6 n=1 Tax=Halobates sericeus TaxID=95703 RepID=UPI002E78C99B|nr:NADH dehydrogenase subunit 6 [Halobates sericeus]WPW46668.1 NADH dehydrogenase subunit 6 [Halobates sericeus]WPW46733.1 NADH dehydrogenase subunit 6 [Halobates sericeus]